MGIARVATSEAHPLIPILITISFSVVLTLSSPSPFDIDKLESNIPYELCEPSGTHADLLTVFLDPPCESAAPGYCGLRRNQNYTFMTKWLPKKTIKALYVRVTTKDPNYGWETPLWPDFSACNRFNISCPHQSGEPIRTFTVDTLPPELFPMRTIAKVRMIGVGEDNARRVILCGQMKAQIY